MRNYMSVAVLVVLGWLRPKVLPFVVLEVQELNNAGFC